MISDIGILAFSIIPFPPSRNYFCFCHRKVFLSHRFVVPKMCYSMRKVFSPFPRTSHMVYDFSTKSLILLGRIGGIHNTMMCPFETCTSKNIIRILTSICVYTTRTIPIIERKQSSSDIHRGANFITIFYSSRSRIDCIHALYSFWCRVDIFRVFEFLGIKTKK